MVNQGEVKVHEGSNVKFVNSALVHVHNSYILKRATKELYEGFHNAFYFSVIDQVSINDT